MQGDDFRLLGMPLQQVFGDRERRPYLAAIALDRRERPGDVEVGWEAAAPIAGP